MSRKKKTIHRDEDGTPREIDDSGHVPEDEGPEEADDDATEPEPEPTAARDPNSAEKWVAKAGNRRLKWTKLGEDRGAFSHIGTHKAGEIVDVPSTDADLLVERGFAEDAD